MRSLRLRIALAYSALIVVAVVGLGLALAREEEQRYRHSLDQRLAAQAGLLAEAAVPLLAGGNSIDGLDPLAKRLGQQGGTRVTIIALDGVVLGDSENDPARLENHGQRPEVLQALSTGVGRSSRYSTTEHRNFTYVAVPVRTGGRVIGIARVSMPVSAVNDDIRRMIADVSAVAAIAGVGAAVLAALVAGAVTRPLRRLRLAARALESGAITQRVRGGGSVEVNDLAAAFNDMASRLQETVLRREQEHSRLEALLASSADGLVALDGDGVVRYLNPAAMALFGEVVGRSLAECARAPELTRLLRDAQTTRSAAPAAPDAGGSQMALVILDARDMWLQATVSPIRDGGGWALLVILHDVTDVRRAEVTRRDFVANVSHELRTPLAGIKAVVETLRDGALEDPAAAGEFLRQVDGEVDRLVQLVEELLQLARMESGAEMELRDTRPNDLLEQVIERFRPQAERAGVSLVLDATRPLPSIEANPAQLGQAVGNLVHNALKFTPPGGNVTVAAEQVGPMLRIQVTDTGSGIDPADLPRIFERFYVADRARSTRGTGLGLAIVKHVVRAHGGSVEVESSLSRGSIFSIALPMAGARAGTLPEERTT